MDFNIKGYSIKKDSKPFIIAEVGINHNGDLDTAFKMIDAAKDCGVDCVKFQTFNADNFCGDKNQTYTYKSQGKEITESMYEMFKRVEFTQEECEKIKQYCDKKNIIFMSTPQDKADLDLLLKIGIPAIKVGSDDFVNLPLLKYYKSKKLPMILSCGMADLEEIKQVLDFIEYQKRPIALLLCTSQYPTPFENINLNKLKTLRKEFPNLILGFSDHSIGSLAASVSVGMEAVIFEKHFTLSHDMQGPDHWFSSTPDELKVWVDNIRNAYISLGTSKLEPTKEEISMRELARRRIIASKDIKKGEIFSEKNLTLKRAPKGLNGLQFYTIVDKIAKNDIKQGNSILKGDFDE